MLREGASVAENASDATDVMDSFLANCGRFCNEGAGVGDTGVAVAVDVELVYMGSKQ